MATGRVPDQTPHSKDLAVIRTHPPSMQLAGITIDRRSDNGTGVHIQPNTRTLDKHWDLPQLWLY